MATVLEKFSNACSRFPETHVALVRGGRLIVVSKESYDEAKQENREISALDVECTIPAPFVMSS